MDEKCNRGLLLALMAALISGTSVFINGMAVKLADPFVYTTLKNTGALVFLAAVVLALTGLSHFRSLSKKQWGLLALIGIIGGSIPFLMFFWGLKLGGAAISSFIFRSLFLFAGVFGYFLLKERPGPKDVAAGFIILIGNALLVSGDIAFGLGQLLVLGATVLWALEYTISRKIMADIHPRAVMVSRMFFGSLVLFAFLFATGSIGAFSLVSTEVLGWLGITSLLLFAFVFTWYSALRYLPVFKAASVLAIGGVITAALELFFLGKTVALTEAGGLILILAGALLMAGAADAFRAVVRSRDALPGLIE